MTCDNIVMLRTLIRFYESEQEYERMAEYCIDYLSIIPDDIGIIKKLMDFYFSILRRNHALQYCFMGAQLGDNVCSLLIERNFRDNDDLKKFLLSIENPNQIILDGIEEVEQDIAGYEFMPFFFLN